ncbi:hypothetical protein ACFPM3_05230 [Streptomyces coeruleoprunus]|uniref:Uncharacterized protein n=1 Tax=Streptomyces coeruleoprunus TaxID=285563 RepID=A0ABV9X7W3_9ACTN
MLEFKTVTFTVDSAPMSAQTSLTSGFSLKGKVRKIDGRPVMNVALQACKLEVLHGGNVHHCSMSLDEVAVELIPSSSAEYDGTVRMTIWRRNHPNDARDAAWKFRGTVTALVVADITSS